MSAGPWTGGLANRAYRAGAHPEPPAGRDAVLAGVRAYLADCRRHPALSAAYHPTEGGAVKIVPGPEQVVRAAFRHLTEKERQRG